MKEQLSLLDKLDGNGQLIGIDFDSYALEFSKVRLEKLNKSFFLHLSNYINIKIMYCKCLCISHVPIRTNILTTFCTKCCRHTFKRITKSMIF